MEQLLDMNESRALVFINDFARQYDKSNTVPPTKMKWSLVLMKSFDLSVPRACSNTRDRLTFRTVVCALLCLSVW
ncbi:hypothetical protein PsorP6_011854 [Peronosclerospora sorghi]|uniref:Uncharacterized protein n=1 Tax=Peronosclerospora sorghi TaxID=230839 RepID=A0ACC0WM09_9STRA|nr:hypothetical protein PsorP6_011854 [Peronosclerospora sorghi]